MRSLLQVGCAKLDVGSAMVAHSTTLSTYVKTSNQTIDQRLQHVLPWIHLKLTVLFKMCVCVCVLTRCRFLKVLQFHVSVHFPVSALKVKRFLVFCHSCNCMASSHINHWVVHVCTSACVHLCDMRNECASNQKQR